MPHPYIRSASSRNSVGTTGTTDSFFLELGSPPASPVTRKRDPRHKSSIFSSFRTPKGQMMRMRSMEEDKMVAEEENEQLGVELMLEVMKDRSKRVDIVRKALADSGVNCVLEIKFVSSVMDLSTLYVDPEEKAQKLDKFLNQAYVVRRLDPE